jgi:uncharacterized protein
VLVFPKDMIDKFVYDTLGKQGRGAHTYEHSQRVLALCLRIGDGIGADIRILGAAALLHDIGRPAESESGVSHSILSGQMSRAVLKELGYSNLEVEQVVSVIRTHRFSEGLEPQTLEGKILSDADKLDAIGSVGIYRAVAQAEVSGRGIKGFLNHADEKLLRLRDLLYTDAAREIALKRHRILEEFVRQLRSELGVDN